MRFIMCYGLNECLPHHHPELNSYIEILIPNARVLEGEAFEWWLGRRSGALVNCP